MAFDVQLYHLEHAVIQVEQCSVVAALRSLLNDKDRQISYWEQKYATAVDALTLQFDSLSHRAGNSRGQQDCGIAKAEGDKPAPAERCRVPRDGVQFEDELVGD